MATARTRHDNQHDCGNCRDAGLLKDAVSFCYECDSHFCVACDKLHRKIAPGHKLDFEEEVDSCVKHSKEITRYYCQEHDAVICKICKQSKHFKCAVQDVPIANGGYDITKNRCVITGQLVKLQEAIDKLKVEKQIALDTYQSDIDVCRQEMGSLKNQFIRLFGEYDSQLELQKSSVIQDLSSSICSCDRLSDQIKEQITFLEDKSNRAAEQLLLQQLINAKNKCKEFKDIFENIRRQTIRYGITIKEDKNHKTLFDQLSKLIHQVSGSVEVMDSDEVVRTSFLNIKSCSAVKEVNVRVHNDDTVPYISGCCLLPDGQVVLCDYYNNNKIKILDKDFNVKFAVPCPPGPYDVDYIDENSVVVTLPSAKALQFMSVNPGFKFNQKKDLKLSCMGVCVHDKNIFVCIDEPEPSKKGVKILNLNGDDVSFISHFGSGELRYLCPNVDGTRIYYTGGSGKDLFINCVTKDGYGIFSVSTSTLNFPRSIVHDESNNTMICDDNNKCIQIVSADGIIKNTLIIENKSAYAPKSMCISKHYDFLIVASHKVSEPRGSKLTLYKLEYF